MPELSQSDRSNLHQLVHMPGWEVFVHMLADEKEMMQKDWLSTDPAHQMEVWALQATARGFHLGVKNVFTRIDAEMEVYRASLEPQIRNMEAEFVESTLSPYGRASDGGLPEENSNG